MSWGPHQEQRKDALEALVQVLADGAGPRRLRRRTGQGEAAERHRPQGDRAGVHRRRTTTRGPSRSCNSPSELQPNDAEIYNALLVCYDKIGDKDGGRPRNCCRAVELSRRDIKLYEQLGQRFAELNQPAEAERAYTSIVEMLPNESESHALLAEVREKQNRWPEAIAHWERVAEIRALEPTGLLKLAAAQIEFKDWDSAAKTLRKLRSQSWPPRSATCSNRSANWSRSWRSDRRSESITSVPAIGGGNNESERHGPGAVPFAFTFRSVRNHSIALECPPGSSRRSARPAELPRT